jgi:hypothetical protein
MSPDASNLRKFQAARHAVVLVLWGVLTGCVTGPGKASPGWDIPASYRYRPSTPEDAPDTAAARKRAQQGQHAQAGLRAGQR